MDEREINITTITIPSWGPTCHGYIKLQNETRVYVRYSIKQFQYTIIVIGVH